LGLIVFSIQTTSMLADQTARFYALTNISASITTLFGLGCLSSLLQKKIPNEIIY
jgi:hypothetical protein